jgi:hypothetical protein
MPASDMSRKSMCLSACVWRLLRPEADFFGVTRRDGSAVEEED